MQASIENLEGLKRLLTVTVPAEDVKQAYAAALKSTSKKARLDGFRKGHIPARVLEQYFGMQMITDAYEQLVNVNLPKAIDEVKTTPVAMPEVSFAKASFDKNGEFVFQATFEVFPVIEDKPLNEMTVKVVKSTVNDADVDKMIETLRSQYGKWQVKDDAVAANGMLVKIDFVGRVDGKEFEGGKAEDFSLHLGTSSMIPGFAEPIVGHKAGDKFTINVTFPEDYHAKELAGKPAEFDITVNSVSERVLPELNDEFIKMFGVTDGSVETFRQELRNNMEREQKRVLIARQHDNVCDALLKYYGEFDVPAALVEQERVDMCKRANKQYEAYHLPAIDPEKNKEIFLAEAVSNARLTCLLRHIVETSGLTEPSEDSINERLNMIAEAYETPEDVKAELRKDKKSFTAIKNEAFERDIFNYIENAAKKEVEETTFTDLLKTGQNQ